MPRRAVTDTFASFHIRNYRLFATGQLVSNTGAWVQRIAQDWLVLTLTGSATAVGLTTALQFLPTLLLGMCGGAIADRYAKRTVLLLTNTGMGLLAAALAALTLTGRVLPWHVYLIAFVLGIVTAIDNPTRQAFVNEMVGPAQLRNAISLNASIFQLGALVGPAVSGYLINAVGAGYSFAINAVSYLAAIVALVRIDDRLLVRTGAPATAAVRLFDGIRLAWSQPAIRWPIVLVGVFGMFSINLPVTLAAYARSEFHSGPGGYGLLTSAVALGSVLGALASARRARTRLRALAGIGGTACAALVLAASAGAEWGYLLTLVAVGASTLLFLTSANSTVQLAAGDEVRGRVMGLYLLVFIGSGSVGGPLLGAIDQHLGPRVGMLLAGLVPGVAMLLVAFGLSRSGRLRLRLQRVTPLIAVIPR
ncbi:MAG TPA: MFS transporter [Jatrophihabitans sp.]|nr:MFS transporter [Jatrophihabitans sp.]